MKTLLMTALMSLSLVFSPMVNAIDHKDSWSYNEEKDSMTDVVKSNSMRVNSTDGSVFMITCESDGSDRAIYFSSHDLLTENGEIELLFRVNKGTVKNGFGFGVVDKLGTIIFIPFNTYTDFFNEARSDGSFVIRAISSSGTQGESVFTLKGFNGKFIRLLRYCIKVKEEKAKP